MKNFLGLLATAFTISIFWAFTQKPISESGTLLLQDPWGIVTLIDLYIGFLIFGLFMFFTIPKKNMLFLWIPSLLILGNVTSLIYLIFYYKKLTALLGDKNENY